MKQRESVIKYPADFAELKTKARSEERKDREIETLG